MSKQPFSRPINRAIPGVGGGSRDAEHTVTGTEEALKKALFLTRRRCCECFRMRTDRLSAASRISFGGSRRGLSLDILQERDERRRGDPRDSRRGAQRCRPRRGEFAANLRREAADRGIVERVREK